MSRLRKGCEEVQIHERERTKRIVYSVIYGVGKESPIHVHVYCLFILIRPFSIALERVVFVYV